MEIEKLDNPIWNSLTETHKDFAVNYDGIRFYKTDDCPFGDFIDLDKTKAGINSYASLSNNFYIVDNKPNFTEKAQLNKELVCNQMILDNRIDLERSEPITKLQNPKSKSYFYSFNFSKNHGNKLDYCSRSFNLCTDISPILD